MNKLMPGGEYVGYVESYGKKLVLNELCKLFKKEEVIMDDDQLVGFMPYIASKALNKPLEEAINLTYVLTNNKQYEAYFKVLDLILKKGKGSLLKSVELMPLEHRDKIKKAILSSNANDFIKDIHDLSCSLEFAMPVIFYLYNKHNNLFESLEENIILGGPSADRAILLGLLFNDDSLPKEWYKYF